MVKDGLLITLLGLKGTPKLINGFGMAVIGPNPNSLRKANLLVGYRVFSHQ